MEDNDKIRFSVEISKEANDALMADAEEHIRSRKAQAEFILEQHYGAKSKQGSVEREAVAA